MKKVIRKHILSIFFLIAVSPVFSQNLDLIINTTGDSIACKIDSIKGNIIYFEMKFNHKWIKTTILKEQVSEYQCNVIKKKGYNYKKGTSIIDSPYILELSYDDFKNSIENLQALSTEEFDLIYNKALRMKKNGAIMTWTCIGTAVTGLILFKGSYEGYFGGSGTWGLGLIMLAGGSLTSIIGIPIYINRASIVARMNNFRSGLLKEINLQPEIKNDFTGNHYYPSLKFTLTF